MILLYQQKNYNGESLMKQKSKKYITIPFMIFSGESDDYVKVPLMSFC